jgi:hypothetical protein
LHRREKPGAPELLPVEVESAWDAADYERVVQLLTPWPKDQLASDYRATTMRVQLVRSLLRLNRADEAIVRAREAAAKAEDRFPLLIAMVGRRDVAEVRKLLEDETLTQRNLHGGVLPTDPELAPLVINSEFAELRREHALGLPQESNDEFYVLLLKEPPVPDAAELRKRIFPDDAAGGPFKIEQASRPSDTWTIVEVRGYTLSIAFGASPFVSADALDRLELRQPDLQRVLDEHRGWISVATILRPRDAASAEQSPARDVAARLCDRNVLGFYYSPPTSYSFHFVAATDDPAGQLTAPPRFAEPLPNSIPLWLTRDDDDSEYSNRQGWIRKRQSLKALARLVAEQPPDRPQAKVLLRRGHADEQQWLAVVSGKHTRYGNYEFVAEFQTASKLWPHLAPGERCRITNYQILDWRER